MAHYGLDVVPESSPGEAPAAEKGLWSRVMGVCLLPFRLAGLFLAFALLMGCFGMWVIPDLAARHEVDMLPLVLRVLDDENTVRPFRLLHYQASIHGGLLDLRPPVGPSGREGSGKDPIASVKMTKAAGGGYVYEVRFASGKSKKLTATTAHTSVPPEELAAARQGVDRIFPPKDRTQRTAVLAWGESLFVTSWLTKYSPEVASLAQFPKPPTGTEDEQLWCVWQVLRGGGAPAEDLDRLPEYFTQSFATSEDQTAALAWADALYDQLERIFQSKRNYFSVSKGSTTGREGRLAALEQLRRVLPPKNDWTLRWLLQQYVGLSPAAREAARQRWLGYFPASRQEQVVALGETLIEERRGKGEPLPNAPEVLPALCVVERLTGTDRHGQACCQAEAKLPAVKLVFGALQLAYPNDDLYYLLASGDPLSVYPFFRHDEMADSVYYVGMTIAMLTLTWLVGLGIQTGLRWIVAPLVLRKATRPLWQKYCEGRGEGPFWLSLVSTFLLAGVGYLTAPWSLPELIAVQIGTPWQLYLGALMATMMGGVLIASCRRVIALFLITFGVDVEETWADEILGILAGAFVLYHFGNDFLAISLFAMTDLLPGLFPVALHYLFGRRQAAHAVPQPA
jgi:hypothetical protein